MKTTAYEVTEELSGRRLDVAVTLLEPHLTRSRVQKLIQEGLILVDGTARKANYRVRPGEVLQVTIPPAKPLSLEPQPLKLDILYEDRELLVINKPKGMVVHPAAGHNDGTLVNALLHYCHDLSGIGGKMRPGIVHRLDKDTSGVLVVAKNDHAHLHLARQFKEQSVVREYVAIVHGKMSTLRGSINAAIARHPRDRKKMAVVPAGKGRPAVTHFTVLEQFANYTYVLLRLETGRTHQIRVHLASLGHPVAGDTVYGYKRQHFNLNGQALHAYKLGFLHPKSEQYMEFTSNPPEEFLNLLNELRKLKNEKN
ncbi:MAG: RluA family pseudouridine synthase [Firmicutes bacterium]|nr:RluA family pseudouridine synthase [Bacillota bacterium]